MTDSKTTDWAEIEAFIVQSAAIEECRTGKKFVLDGYPFVTGAAREVLDRHISQALAAVDHRAYARGIEDAAKVGFQVSQHVHAKADDVSKAIRQLLEVKG